MQKIQSGGVLIMVFLFNVFHRGPYGPILRSNWTPCVQLLLEVGLYQYFSIATFDFACPLIDVDVFIKYFKY